jgi:thymidine kinase
MFAGKTTALIQRCREAQAAGRKVLVLKSAKDATRYASHALATHDGATLPCHITHSLLHVHLDLGALFAEASMVAIDEGQFFPDLLEFVHLAADKLHKTVVIAALDGDFKRQRFGQVLDVLPMADVVHKLHARCYAPGCTHPAVFSMRTSADASQELVGGRDLYVAACRHHYLQPSSN